MLGEFKCDQDVFVHLFRKTNTFYRNGSRVFLSTQMSTSLAHLFQHSMWKCDARR